MLMDSAGDLWAAIWWTCPFFLKPFACGQLLESAGTKHCHISFENSEVSVMGLSWKVECLLDSMWRSQTAFSVLCGSSFVQRFTSPTWHCLTCLAWKTLVFRPHPWNWRPSRCCGVIALTAGSLLKWMRWSQPRLSTFSGLWAALGFWCHLGHLASD